MSTAQDLIDRQGWNDETMLRLYDEFVARMNLDDAFLEYLELVASEENAECGKGSGDPEDSYQCINPGCPSAGTYHDHDDNT